MKQVQRETSTHRSAGGLFLILMLMSIFCSKVKSLKINECIRINSVQDFSHSGTRFVLWRTEGSFVCGGILLPLKQNKVVKDPRGLAGTCAADSRAANMWWRNTSAEFTFTWICCRANTPSHEYLNLCLKQRIGTLPPALLHSFYWQNKPGGNGTNHLSFYVNCLLHELQCQPCCSGARGFPPSSLFNLAGKFVLAMLL